MLDESFQVIDPRFAEYVMGNVHVEKLYTGCRWAEGPVYFGDGRFLLWSDIPNDRIMRWDETDGSVSVFRQSSNNANGHTRDRHGRLISCEHAGRRVTRTEPDGAITVLADNYQGKRLNSPNDVVVKSDGSIWFTDPSYGILSEYEGNQAESEIGACYVYRIDGDNGDLSVVADDFDKPNGLAFSPDESILYIADTGASHDPDGPRHIRALDVSADGRTLSNSRVFATCDNGLFDGFRCDTDGNVWSSAADGVHCYTPDGTLIGKILIPEVVANVVFGGPKMNRLFICGTTSIYSAYLNRRGA
ncbi:MAG: SMP-30/gluconolactonase/LRE family protein [Alphaproteobacteria bacterium]